MLEGSRRSRSLEGSWFQGVVLRLHSHQYDAWQRPEGSFRALPNVPPTRYLPPPYSPTALAAFSRNREPSRMYRRSIAVPLWPVCSAMTRSGTPAAAAEVARPARNECPATSPGIMPIGTDRRVQCLRHG